MSAGCVAVVGGPSAVTGERSALTGGRSAAGPAGPLLVLASLLLVLAASPVTAQSRVRTTVDTTLVTVGDRIVLSVSVDHPGATSVGWPDSLDLAPFEVLDARLLPPEQVGEGYRSTMQLALTVFELGELEIPSFEISVPSPDGGADLVSTDRFGIEVVSVGADETGDIREIRGPLLIPLSALRVALLGLVLLLLAALAFAAWRRWRPEREPVEAAPGPPPRPAHEVALEELDRLLASPMLERGAVKDFHIEASDIVRRYVEARFSVPALEMTTWEIVEGLERTGVDVEAREQLRRFLDRCDLVKFAKVRPSIEESTDTVQAGRTLVEQTVAHMTGVA